MKDPWHVPEVSVEGHRRFFGLQFFKIGFDSSVHFQSIGISIGYAYLLGLAPNAEYWILDTGCEVAWILAGYWILAA